MDLSLFRLSLFRLSLFRLSLFRLSLFRLSLFRLRRVSLQTSTNLNKLHFRNSLLRKPLNCRLAESNPINP
jgi:hypothetical protein